MWSEEPFIHNADTGLLINGVATGNFEYYVIEMQQGDEASKEVMGGEDGRWAFESWLKPAGGRVNNVKKPLKK